MLLQYQGGRLTVSSIRDITLKRLVKYYCMNKHGCKCNAALDIKLVSGVADTSDPIRIGMHSQGCCVKMGLDTESYEWEGEAWSPKEIGGPVAMVESSEAEKENLHPNIPAKRPKQALDVKEEMKICISVLAFLT